MGALHNWYRSAGGILIPAGIIMPFNDVAANIPSGWTQWTAAGNRALRHDPSNIGAQGGSTAVSRSTSSNGLHCGSANTWWLNTSPGSVADKFVGTQVGSHGHSVQINYSPPRRYQVMMKLLADAKKFPAKTGLLSDSVLSGLTDITPTGLMLYGGNGASNEDHAATKSMSSVSSNGNHYHIQSGSGSGSGATANCYGTNYSSVAHTHGVGTPTVTDEMYRYYLGMWTNASAEMSAVPGVYGIWESVIAPEGWAICDGTNGTPDLTGYMIGLDSGSNIGTKSGNGTITTSGSLSTGGHHSHQNSWVYQTPTATANHASVESHSHSVSAAASSFNPLYHNVCFIKCIG